MFTVLSETLYNLLQLVSVAEWNPICPVSAGIIWSKASEISHQPNMILYRMNAKEFGLLVEKCRPVSGFECTRENSHSDPCLAPSHLFSSCFMLYQDWEQRQEEDNLLIERILLLVRNVLHIPTDPNEEKVRVNVFWPVLETVVCLYMAAYMLYDQNSVDT